MPRTEKHQSNKRLHKLESGWNDLRESLDQLDTKRKWTRLSNISDSHKELIKLPGSVDLPQLDSRVVRPNTASGGFFSSYDFITKTFGFKRHEGTDRNLELYIYKSILKRESILEKLQRFCDDYLTLNEENQSVSLILSDSTMTVMEGLNQIRYLALEIIEMVSFWRRSMSNYDPEFPRPFMFRTTNYLLKLISDMDFIADVPYFSQELAVNASQLRVNPLLLPNTLADFKSNISIEILASRDADGEETGSEYDLCVRYRKAEIILYEELEFNKDGPPDIDWENFSNSSNNKMKKKRHSFDTSETSTKNVLSWKLEAHLQLEVLEHHVGESLRSFSTNRQPVAPVQSLPQDTKYMYPRPVYMSR